MSINETNVNQANSLAHAAASLSQTFGLLSSSASTKLAVEVLISRLSAVATGLLAEPVKETVAGPFHTLDEDFDHFVAYSGFHNESADVLAKIKIAYAENWKPHSKLPVSTAPAGDEVIVNIETTPGLTVDKLEDLSTLEAYFVRAAAQNIIDFTLRCTHHQEGEGAHFYIHPANISGETLQFVVRENLLRNV
jgi:hypothetical protein